MKLSWSTPEFTNPSRFCRTRVFEFVSPCSSSLEMRCTLPMPRENPTNGIFYSQVALARDESGHYIIAHLYRVEGSTQPTVKRPLVALLRRRDALSLHESAWHLR